MHGFSIYGEECGILLFLTKEVSTLVLEIINIFPFRNDYFRSYVVDKYV